MDKLLLSEGGQPLHLDDIEFLQGSCQGPLATFLGALGDYIIGGCVITTDTDNKTIQWTGGYIAFGGKVYKVSPGSINMPSEMELWQLYWTFNCTIGGLKIFGDGSSLPTQELYHATLSASSDTPLGEYMVADTAPVLGRDIVRLNRLAITISKVSGVEVLSVAELSDHSAVITLRLNGASYVYNSQVCAISVEGMGQYHCAPVTLRSSVAYLETASDGKIYMRRIASPDGSSTSHYTISEPMVVGLLVSWDKTTASSSSGGQDSSDTYRPRGGASSSLRDRR